MEPARAQKEIRIDAPPKKVFEALTDLDAADAWMNGLVNVEMETDGDFGVGTRWVETRRIKLFGFIPVSAKAKIEITAFHKGRHYTAEADDGCNWMAYTFSVKKDAKGTLLTLAMAAMGSGKYADNPKIGPKLLKMAEKMDGDMLERFKEHVETP